MEGDSPALEEHLYGGVGETEIDLFMDQPAGDTVVMVIHLDVVIDTDLGPAPLGIGESMGGMRRNMQLASLALDRGIIIMS